VRVDEPRRHQAVADVDEVDLREVSSIDDHGRVVEDPQRRSERRVAGHDALGRQPMKAH
jgi:hypothetical protein